MGMLRTDIQVSELRVCKPSAFYFAHCDYSKSFTKRKLQLILKTRCIVSLPLHGLSKPVDMVSKV